MINLKAMRRFLLNFPLGMLVGTIMAFLLVWMLEADFSAKPDKIMPNILERNIPNVFEKVIPNIFTAAVGLIAATLALAGVLSNIQTQIDLKEREKDQKLRAARAVLPLTLSRIHKNCSLGYSIAAENEVLRSDPVLARERLKTLEISNDDLKTLKECIEFADPSSAAWLSLMIAHYQLEISRLHRSIFDTDLLVLEYQTASQAADWALIQTFVNHLFNFSRTGERCADTLPKEDFQILFDFLPFSQRSHEIGEAISRTKRYFDEKGGWSAAAFQNRLLAPNLKGQ